MINREKYYQVNSDLFVIGWKKAFHLLQTCIKCKRVQSPPPFYDRAFYLFLRKKESWHSFPSLLHFFPHAIHPIQKQYRHFGQIHVHFFHHWPRRPSTDTPREKASKQGSICKVSSKKEPATKRDAIDDHTSIGTEHGAGTTVGGTQGREWSSKVNCR